MQIVPVVDISHAKYYNFTAAKYIILRFRERLKICSSNRIVIKSIEMRDVQRIHLKKMDTILRARKYKHFIRGDIVSARCNSVGKEFFNPFTFFSFFFFPSKIFFFLFFFFHRYFSFFFSFEWKLDDYIQKRETHGKFSIHDNSVIEN